MHIEDDRGNQVPVSYIWEIGDKYRETLLEDIPELDPLIIKYNEQWLFFAPQLDEIHWKFAKMLKKHRRLSLVLGKRKAFVPESGDITELDFAEIINSRRRVEED